MVGSTSKEQLLELMRAAAQGPLGDEVTAAVDAVHQQYPNPTP